MMENPQGEKHQIETLRNLRTVFTFFSLVEIFEMTTSDWLRTMKRGELDQTPATEIVKLNLTPVPRELTRIRIRFTIVNCHFDFRRSDPSYTWHGLNLYKK